MLLYNLVVRCYGAAIRAASFKNTKARQWVEGRKNWAQQLRQALTDQKGKIIWVHCASYGEFEQGRPVMEALRKKYPGASILLTFFSPSGYEAFKNWKGADHVCYLPLDTRTNAHLFLDIVQPRLILFIKYEFWLNFLTAIRKRQIPCYLVSAVFKPHHPFFKWYGSIFRRSLKSFRQLFIQDEGSGYLLRNIGIENFLVTGDTRFDRVMQIRSSFVPIEEISDFKGNSRMVIAGSTWEGDERLILEAFVQMPGDVKLLIVPHEVDAKSIAETKQRLEEMKLEYCLFSEGIDPHKRIMVLNTMGMLARSYYYADCAYIGGGFDGGLHNSLEAAVFGIPVTFYGKDYTRFNEAVELLSLGVAVNVKTAEGLRDAWNRFLEKDAAESIRQILHAFFEKNRDSTGRVLTHVEM